MQLRRPKNTKEFYWTEHSLFKMRYYGLSAQKILGVIKRPDRKEEGIVKNTIAVMQPASTRVDRSSTRLDSARLARGGPVNPKIQNGKKTWKQEVWVMYQIKRIMNKELGIKNIEKEKLKNIQKFNPPAGGQNSAKRQLRIISAWRYPGVSPLKNPIPGDILTEIESLI